ncbi:hypothetical protein [Cryobacterium sp. Y29]|uniref:hypothetical protein n=1 Tax=Cryobacterium sp. Y29 TaxID=2048285 RepID=UPI0011AFF561|nr:hypothetical protein [Cryobacterium sp. Y29]
MKTRFTITSLGVITAAALAITTLTAGARPEIQSLAADSLVPEFGTAQSTTDVLPEILQPLVDDAPLDEDSVRLIAQSSYGTHWVALDANEDICIITYLKDETAGGANCMPRAQFHAKGASLLVGGPSGPGVVAHLLPAGLEEPAVQEAIATHDAGASEARGIPEDNTGTAESSVEIFADAGLVVLNENTAAALGSVHVPRAGQQDLVLYDMAP